MSTWVVQKPLTERKGSKGKNSQITVSGKNVSHAEPSPKGKFTTQPKD